MKSYYILFFTLIFKLSATVAEYDQCREKILESTCLMERQYLWDYKVSPLENQKNRRKIGCLPESIQYARNIYRLYQDLPDHTKSAFCFINKIYIVPGETNFGGRASLSYLDGAVIEYNEVKLKADGFILELSKRKRFDLKMSALEHMNRLSQLPFGVSSIYDKLPDSSIFPIYLSNSYDGKSSVFGTIIHEVGHFLDFINTENKAVITYDEENGWGLEQNDWLSTSWEFKASDDFFEFLPILDSELAQNPIDQMKSSAAFYSLLKSPFVSFYSFTSVPEDFAEFYKHSVSKRDISVQFPDGTSLKHTELKDEKYREKLVLMEKYKKLHFSNVMNLETYWQPRDGNEVMHYVHSHCHQ